MAKHSPYHVWVYEPYSPGFGGSRPPTKVLINPTFKAGTGKGQLCNDPSRNYRTDCDLIYSCIREVAKGHKDAVWTMFHQCRTMVSEMESKCCIKRVDSVLEKRGTDNSPIKDELFGINGPN